MSCFTLPGESGYEKLTMELAKKWGADVIRDSDGTVLSDELINSGYGIYSTICIIRDHNEWANNNMDKLQQCFLSTNPVVAEPTDKCELKINIMKDFFDEQFAINDTADAFKYWQVYDRTLNAEIPRENWTYDADKREVTICAEKWHKYTVSFLAYRIWEEISMYNHVTNNWTKEHLMQIDPMYPETREYLVKWMKNWCETHPATTVVRFTSLFYNFVWIWGSDSRNRHLFADWASYDFTVSALALDLFEKKYGYRMTAEDFINKGKLHPTHSVPDSKKADWMEFINDFVISFGKELIKIVHDYGKKAYVFYDDSWVGLEPYNDRFHEFGFDGLIKCVFSGFEVRLCAGVETETHEIRLHPYLFPVGLGGAPTFMEGGNPALDANLYWRNVRRALLRKPVDRIGLGGYLHLVESFPDFVDCITRISDEFRMIKDFHAQGSPVSLKPKIAVLSAWGSLRSWTLSGHFHETYMHDLIHVLESLSGLPFDVSFIDFKQLEKGVPDGVDIIINAGYKDSAWSGGFLWNEAKVVENLTSWVNNSGTYIGINEPSAVDGYDTTFRMAHILGVDMDEGERVCHGKWKFEVETTEGLIPKGATFKTKQNIYLIDGKTQVLAEKDGIPTMTSRAFGKGKGIYLSSFETSPENTRLLLNTILYAANENLKQDFITDSIYTECAYYPENKRLVIINNSEKPLTTCVSCFGKPREVSLQGFETIVIEIE